MFRSDPGKQRPGIGDRQRLDLRIARALVHRRARDSERGAGGSDMPTPPLTNVAPLPASQPALEDTTIVELPWVAAGAGRDGIWRRPKVLAATATIATAALIGGVVVGAPILAPFDSKRSEAS